MDRDGLAGLFARSAWRDTATSDVDVTVEVARDDVGAWLAGAYYPIERLMPPARRAFDEWTERHLDELAPAGVMTWTFALREVVTHRR